MEVFASRMIKVLPALPDVILVQEVNSKSTHYIAKVMTKKTNQKYTVATDAGEKAQYSQGNKIIKADMGIVMNAKTMSKAGKSGYILSRFNRPNSPPEIKRNARAFLGEKGSDLRIGFVSIHIPPGNNYAKRVRGVAEDLQKAYPPKTATDFLSVGGDFNGIGVDDLGESQYGQVKTEGWWDVLTRPPFNHSDSLYNVLRDNSVDHVFTNGGVLGAGWDRNYNNKMSESNSGFYSNHRFVWGIIGVDEDPPTVPTNLDSISRKNQPKLRVKVTWNESKDANGIWQYEIWRSGNGGVDYKKVGVTPHKTYYDYDVQQGQKYHYYVVARDWSSNESGPSQVIQSEAGGD